MTNPFDGFSGTEGGRAGLAAFEKLKADKEYDDKTISLQSAPETIPPVPNPHPDFVIDVVEVDWKAEERVNAQNLRITVEAVDIDLESRFITPINLKKSQIVTIVADAFNSKFPNQPTGSISGVPANERLKIVEISNFSISSDAPDFIEILNNKEVGISTFAYGTVPDGLGGTNDVYGLKGKVFKDILAANHYPNITNSSAESLLPLNDPEFKRVSSASAHAFPSSKYYKDNSLAIGDELISVDDDNVTSSTINVYTQSTGAEIGELFIFEDLSAVINSGAATSITNITAEIVTLRSELASEINNTLQKLRQAKHRAELDVWCIDAGERSTNLEDYQGGMNALTGLATTIAAYDG